MSQPRTQWLIYAIASGGCAALNGVFAKLTTTKLTTTWATAIARFFGIDASSAVVEYGVRIVSARPLGYSAKYGELIANSSSSS